MKEREKGGKEEKKAGSSRSAINLLMFLWLFCSFLRLADRHFYLTIGCIAQGLKIQVLKCFLLSLLCSSCVISLHPSVLEPDITGQYHGFESIPHSSLCCSLGIAELVLE